MSIFNRRNALIGYVTWSIGKRVVKSTAKDAAPSIDPESKRPNKSAIALAVATVGVLAFWRHRSGGGGDEPSHDAV